MEYGVTNQLIFENEVLKKRIAGLKTALENYTKRLEERAGSKERQHTNKHCNRRRGFAVLGGVMEYEVTNQLIFENEVLKKRIAGLKTALENYTKRLEECTASNDNGAGIWLDEIIRLIKDA